MPHRQGPELGKVESASSDGQGYVCSVSLLDAATLEENGQKLEGVAINPIWAGPEGAGLFALPTVGQVVVLEYLGLNRAFPYVVGPYGKGRAGAELQAGELLLTQGAKGAALKFDAQGLVSLASQAESLKGLLTALMDDLSAIKTAPVKSLGEPVTLAPDDITKIQAYKTRLGSLLAD